MKKAQLAVVVAVVAFCAILSFAVLVFRNQGICGTPYLPKPTPTPTETAASIKAPSAGYLEDTKIYLISTNYTYGVYPEDLHQQLTNITVIHRGGPCFFLNLTLRNDYKDNETFPNRWGDNGGQNFGFAALMLWVSFFDESGREMNTTNVTHASVPFYNRDAFSIPNCESETVQWVFAIPNGNIDRFNVTIGYLGPLPVP